MFGEQILNLIDFLSSKFEIVILYKYYDNYVIFFNKNIEAKYSTQNSSTMIDIIKNDIKILTIYQSIKNLSFLIKNEHMIKKIKHNYNKKYFKYLSVEMNMILMKPLYLTHSQEVEVISVDNVATTTVTTSTYIDHFASVGLKVSMGLWK
jgi:hypothetical protein